MRQRESDVAVISEERKTMVSMRRGGAGHTGVPVPIKGRGRGTSRLNGGSVREGSYVDVSGWQQRQTSQ